MRQQVAGMVGTAVRVEIGGCGGGGEALLARTDRHRDHVLFQPLVIADAGVASGRQHVDEAVLRDHLQDDVGIGGEKAWDDRGQHQPRDADGDVQPQRPRGPVAEPVDDIQRRLDLAERRPQPVEQARAGLGGCDAARGAVEQADAQPLLQPADRFAERRRAAARRTRGVAKAARARHRDEGVEVTEVRRHYTPLPNNLCRLYPVIDRSLDVYMRCRQGDGR